MSDQATRLRELVGRQRRPARDNIIQADVSYGLPAPRPMRIARTLAVTSGKGGVGKSHISVNLAVQLAARGKKVILLDADLGLANIDVMLGIQPKATLAHVVGGEKDILDVITEGPEGLMVVPGASGIEYLANLRAGDRIRLLGDLARLENECDVLIIDTGAGISESTISFAAAADVVLVVATPEITSITDAYATIKSIAGREGRGKLTLAVNMARNRIEAERVAGRIRDVARDFLGVSVEPAGYVLRDRHVAHALRKRRPLVLEYPNAQSSACIRTLATRMTRILGVAAPIRRGGFFERIKTLFRRAGA